jgi:hypothetical protein
MMYEATNLTEAIEAARRVLGWGDTSAQMDRDIPKLAEIIARHVDRQVRDRIAADLTARGFIAAAAVVRFVQPVEDDAARIAGGEVRP